MKRHLGRWICVLGIILTVSPLWGGSVVTRDQYGIPAIQADTEEELFEQFGYVIAVDRLWQMEVNKRWGRGTLAEIFGPKLIPADMQTRLLDYTDEEYQAIFDKLSGDARKVWEAYFRGVNRRVDEVLADPTLLPMEYMALKIKPRHFSVIDGLGYFKALLRHFGMVGGGEFKNLADLQVLSKRFGKSDGWAVFNDWCWINDPSAPTYIRESINGDFVPGNPAIAAVPDYLKMQQDVAARVGDQIKLAAAIRKETEGVGAPVELGSNSWTLSPAVTGTGYPILVGQPQMGHSVPTIIAEVQLRGGRFDVVGMTFPLLPAVPIGHNHFLAWSHMVGMCDNVDVYQEALNPLNREEYLYNGAWRRMEKRTETINVAGGESRQVVIYRTIHGPVFSPFPFDPQASGNDLAYTRKLAHWLKEPLSADGWLGMMTAQNADQFGVAASMIMTSLHTTYADIEGNIGYWHTGLNPERAAGFDPRLPLPGTGEAEWTGRYLPNAQVLNPPKGYVTGWNNKASPDTRNPFDNDPNYNVFGRYNRAQWLERALAGRHDLNLQANEAVMRFIGGAGAYYINHHNAVGGFCKDLLPAAAGAVQQARPEEKILLTQMLAVLVAWDGRSVNDVVGDQQFQAGQTIFTDWLPRLLKATFEDEFVGVDEIKDVHNQIIGLFLRCLDGDLSTLPVSRNYFDNINTPESESMQDIFLLSLRESAAHLKQEFGNDDPSSWKAARAKIIFRHSMFGEVAQMWDNNVGTYIQIVELRPEGAVGRSRWPLGQSGFISPGPDKKPVFDPHFFDMLPLYKGYTYQKMGVD